MEAGANQYLPHMEQHRYPIEVAKENEFEEIVTILEEYKNRARNVPPKMNKHAVVGKK